MNSQEKARRLRQQQTATEAMLWEHLRNRKLSGYKFRRQYPIEHYIVDFICLSEKLIVELDGHHHAEREQQDYDQIRTLFLQASGYHILRFWNQQLTEDMNAVLQSIQQQCEGKSL